MKIWLSILFPNENMGIRTREEAILTRTCYFILVFKLQSALLFPLQLQHFKNISFGFPYVFLYFVFYLSYLHEYISYLSHTGTRENILSVGFGGNFY